MNRVIPYELQIENVTCAIDDDLETDCLLFLENGPTSKSECTVDIKFTYQLTNIGLNCINIAKIRAKAGPLGNETLVFDDLYNYFERDLCQNETWAVPDRRSSVNLCEKLENSPSSWNIFLHIDEFYGKTANATSYFTWSFSPSLSPSSFPSLSPTIDTCTDCTLTSVISGGRCKYSKSFSIYV